MSLPSLEFQFARFRERRDVTALADVFDRAAPALLRVAVHLATRPAEAEDLVQATFLDAIQGADRWDSRSPLLPWLLGILQNEARAQRRRAARIPDPERLARAEDIARDPADTAAANELAQSVDRAIADLDEPCRSVVRLSVVYGHAPAEIAHILDRAPATVRSQLARGLARLRKALPAGVAAALSACDGAPGVGLEAVRAAVLDGAAKLVATSTPTATASGSGFIEGVLLAVKSQHALLLAGALGLCTIAGVSLVRSLGAPAAPRSTTDAEARELIANVPATDSRTTGPVGVSRRNAETATGTPDGTSRIAVRVLRDGQPVAGAEVFNAPSFDGPTSPDGARDIVALLRDAGERAPPTDGDGRTWIPKPKVNAVSFMFAGAHPSWSPPPFAAVVARHGGDLGLGVLGGAPTRGVEIHLRPDRELRVSVVDADGTPAAGVRIGVERRARALDPVEYALLGATDAAGTLTIRHAQLIAGAGDGDAASCRLRVHALGIDRVSDDLGLDDLAAGITFRLPPTGRLRILLPGPGIDPETTTELSVADERVDEFRQATVPGQLREHLVPDRRETTIRWVGLDRTLRVRAENLTTATVEHRGPSRPGETTVCEVEVAATPTVSGRLVEPDGTPIAGAWILGMLHRRGGDPILFGAQCGDDGRLRKVLGTEHLGVEVHRIELCEQRPRAGRGAVVPKPGALRVGLELGDVTLHDLPVLLAGRLVDAQGEPVDPLAQPQLNARVQAFPIAGPPIWYGARLRQGGRFEIRGFANADRFRFSASARGFADFEIAEVARGTTDIEVRLRPQVARLMVPIPDPRGTLGLGLDLALFRTDTESSARRPIAAPFQTQRGTDLLFSWRELPRGIYRLEGRFAGRRSPWLVVDDIDLRRGDTTDPRLEDIRLPADLRTVRLTLVDENGQAFRDRIRGTVLIAYPDDPLEFEQCPGGISGAVVTIPLRAPSVDVVVAVPGRPPVHLTGVREDRRVRLPAGVGIPIRIDADPDLRGSIRVRATSSTALARGYRVTAADPEACPLPGRSFLHLTLPDDARHHLAVAGAGSYRLEVFRSHGGRLRPIAGCSPSTVHVPAEGVPAPVRLSIPRQAFDAASGASSNGR